jgi:hypothetical protein
MIVPPVVQALRKPFSLAVLLELAQPQSGSGQPSWCKESRAVMSPDGCP